MKDNEGNVIKNFNVSRNNPHVIEISPINPIISTTPEQVEL